MAGSKGAGEVCFDLDAAAFSNDEFRVNQFKVKRCPRARPHDWTQCPFAHSGEKAKRRDPRRFQYSGTACPEFRRNGCCRRGDACPFAHGVFECWLHPSRYRTQMCTDGTACKRRVCFFAHTESELRKQESQDDPAWLHQQLQSELQSEQQVHHKLNSMKAYSSMLGNQPMGQEAPQNNTIAAIASLLGLMPQLGKQQGQQQQSSQGPESDVAATLARVFEMQQQQSGGSRSTSELTAQQQQLLFQLSQTQQMQHLVQKHQQQQQQDPLQNITPRHQQQPHPAGPGSQQQQPPPLDVMAYLSQQQQQQATPAAPPVTSQPLQPQQQVTPAAPPVVSQQQLVAMLHQMSAAQGADSQWASALLAATLGGGTAAPLPSPAEAPAAAPALDRALSLLSISGSSPGLGAPLGAPLSELPPQQQQLASLMCSGDSASQLQPVAPDVPDPAPQPPRKATDEQTVVAAAAPSSPALAEPLQQQKQPQQLPPLSAAAEPLSASAPAQQQASAVTAATVAQLQQEQVAAVAAMLGLQQSSEEGQALASLWAGVAGRPGLMANAKVLLEGLQMLQAGGVSLQLPGTAAALPMGPPEGVASLLGAADTGLAMARNSSFDEIMNDLPRSLSETAYPKLHEGICASLPPVSSQQQQKQQQQAAPPSSQQGGAGASEGSL